MWFNVNHVSDILKELIHGIEVILWEHYNPNSRYTKNIKFSLFMTLQLHGLNENIRIACLHDIDRKIEKSVAAFQLLLSSNGNVHGVY